MSRRLWEMVDIGLKTSFEQKHYTKMTWEEKLKMTIFVTYDTRCNNWFSIVIGRVTIWRSENLKILGMVLPIVLFPNFFKIGLKILCFVQKLTHCDTRLTLRRSIFFRLLSFYVFWFFFIFFHIGKAWQRIKECNLFRLVLMSLEKG